MANRLVITDNVDPWHNLALEEYLFETQEDGVTLYLWQNRNTVVIGRNQNAWKECRVQLLEAEGGKLARRSSGGGAVFHDMGNLNFTFILPRKDYDLARQFAVLQQAVFSYGIETELSGRNDVTLKDSGAKFSGNAFRFDTNTALHHGTILIHADMGKLSRYLAPSKQKLAAKGIESVRSRVCNLQDINSDITMQGMLSAMCRAFEKEYDTIYRIYEDVFDKSRIDALCERYAAWEWRFGKTPRFDISFENRFNWGEIQMLLHVENGCVKTCKVFSDVIDASLPEKIDTALQGAPFSHNTLAERLMGIDTIGQTEKEDLSCWIANQSC